MTEIDMGTLDMREKLARIDQALADHDRQRQEKSAPPINAGPLASAPPWLLVISGMAAGAAFFGPGPFA